MSYLRRHKVTTAAQLNWHKLRNGDLLAAAEARGFDVLVTCDRSLRYQQDFTGRSLAVVILSSNQWSLLKVVAARIGRLIDFVQRGQIRYIDITEL